MPQRRGDPTRTLDTRTGRGLKNASSESRFSTGPKCSSSTPSKRLQARWLLRVRRHYNSRHTEAVVASPSGIYSAQRQIDLVGLARIGRLARAESTSSDRDIFQGSQASRSRWGAATLRYERREWRVCQPITWLIVRVLSTRALKLLDVCALSSANARFTQASTRVRGGLLRHGTI